MPIAQWQHRAPGTGHRAPGTGHRAPGTGHRAEDETPTLGAWLELVDARGWSDDSVWLHVRTAAERALASVRGRLRPGEAEELVANVVLAARVGEAGWRRPELRGLPFERWLVGVLRNELRVLRRDELCVSAVAVESVPACDDDPDRTPIVDERAVASLTPAQLASWDLLRGRVGSRLAARKCGISRTAHRQRIQRAARRIAGGAQGHGSHDAVWMPEAARSLAADGDRINATLLLLRCAGWSCVACAAELRISATAVASRLARLRRLWRTSLTSAPSDMHRAP